MGAADSKAGNCEQIPKKDNEGGSAADAAAADRRRRDDEPAAEYSEGQSGADDETDDDGDAKAFSACHGGGFDMASTIAALPRRPSTILSKAFSDFNLATGSDGQRNLAPVLCEPRLKDVAM